MYKHSTSFKLADLPCLNNTKIESHTFTAAMRIVYIYWRYWKPQGIEKKLCYQKPGNVFVRFTTKTVKENGKIVGHLVKEILCITKYYLDQDASVYCRSFSKHYRRSPLTERGLEIE